MKYVFVFLTLFCGLASACESDVQKNKMAEVLYANTEMRNFVCASNLCELKKFREGLQFHLYKKEFQGGILSVCLVEPVLSAANIYTGVFATAGGDYELQLISYGTGIKLHNSKCEGPVMMEYGVSDPDGHEYSVDKYLWRGSGFIFVGGDQF